ncbi:ferric reductase [Metschnikowia bicuspidata var. bicuspidata NRRL YB-4993]|uniref:ferric-chelate reductase (NADPH) n=1 Tax=Metschnikowia bicuspidata var. bicuspidata NRRL YB-4993 TaxID=869754 RepID=A0A1A0HET1_9ASCO|nr:ferric reductase [Metschnikowia bicuspidata var. bicuspidata NRRL YB-4993]OBA22634.1 ferric reductase [Metschnikowia bicuspidata var. bicuspidata NRRL YB-4993]
MAIPFAEQYFVEKERNFKYLFLSVAVSILLPILHGVFFLWVPWVLRGRRTADTIKYKPYFTVLKYYETLTKTFNYKMFGKVFYFQPSLLLVAAFHIGITTIFAISETKDLTYETWYYIVSKRVGRLSIAHVPITLILVAKNNIVSAASGLTIDKTVFLHKWYGRSMFITAIIHMSLSLKYWLGIKFEVMVLIPPQIFGFIAFSCLGMMNVASLKFIRNMAFDFFLAQHRIFNFIMLLLAYFHNGGNHAAVILGVHLLVADRIVGRVMGIIHKRRGPTKGLCDFEILDESTVRVSIPIKPRKTSNRWYWFFLPRYRTWRAGQHVLFNCNKVALLAYHPFTISSLPESGKMVLVIKVQTGFTKQLHKKLCKMTEIEDPESIEGCTGINGPFGANYQPLTKFDSIVFFSAGSGATFTLPVALDLLQTLQQRDESMDYLYRPQSTQIRIVMVVKKWANLQWFDHLWRHFIPFLSSGRAQLVLHITQEVANFGEENYERNKEKLTNIREASTEFNDEASSSRGSFPNLDTGGVSILQGRPDLESIITSSVERLCSPSYRKAFACVSCGPEAFNQNIKSVCNKSRWLPKAPDIYCYEESFE